MAVLDSPEWHHVPGARVHLAVTYTQDQFASPRGVGSAGDGVGATYVCKGRVLQYGLDRDCGHRSGSVCSRSGSVCTRKVRDEVSRRPATVVQHGPDQVPMRSQRSAQRSARRLATVVQQSGRGRNSNGARPGPGFDGNASTRYPKGSRQEGAGPGGARQEGARQEGARQEGARQAGARQGGARQGGARQGGARQGGARQEGARQEGARQEGAGQEGKRYRYE